MNLLVLLSCIAGLLATGVCAIALQRMRAVTPAIYGAALCLSLAACAQALFWLVAPFADEAAAATVLPLGLPWLGAHFRIDGLSAFFAVVVNLGGAAASLYGIGYGRHEAAPMRVLPFFPVFLGAMNLVLIADDAFTFLLSWEFMSLASWALVLAHHRHSENARAALVYIVMASFGTLSLLLAFGLLAGGDGGYSFTDIRSESADLTVAGLVLVLALLGAGSKSGLVPLHVWLPLAHPAAPSHVSALMSGVMTKVAVYGFIRIVFDLLGEPSWWSSMLVLAIGALSAVLGVLYALMQNDLKRLLACSTVENLGMIYVGLGLALGFQANGMGWAAALALTAALLHVFNHSLFKSLLFFAAGAVLTATGERDLERLGGLIRRMPQTAFVCLVGCAAISALPPLNGFVSEWLTFQSILQSPLLPQWGLKVMVPAVGGLLALAAALAAACFVRAFGIAFLGRPRSTAAQEATETDVFSLSAMFLLAGLCLLAGILPGLVIDALAPISYGLLGDSMPLQQTARWMTIVPIAESRSSYNGLLVLLFIAVSCGATLLVMRRLAPRGHRRGPAWGCGYPESSPATQYTAASFAQPLRRVFAVLAFQAREAVDMPAPGDMRPARLRTELRDPVWQTLYLPVWRAVEYAADRCNRMQFLTIRRYLSMVFLALVLLLLVLAIWQ